MTAITMSATGSTTKISVTGPMTDADAGLLRKLLVSAIWHQRPAQIIVDVAPDVVLDDLAIGGLVAASAIAAEHHLTLGVRCASAPLARELSGAGILLLDTGE